MSKKRKRCKRCGKRWCGTDRMTRRIYPDDPYMWSVSYGTRKCRDKGSKR